MVSVSWVVDDDQRGVLLDNPALLEDCNVDGLWDRVPVSVGRFAEPEPHWVVAVGSIVGGVLLDAVGLPDSVETPGQGVKLSPCMLVGDWSDETAVAFPCVGRADDRFLVSVGFGLLVEFEA